MKRGIKFKCLICEDCLKQTHNNFMCSNPQKIEPKRKVRKLFLKRMKIASKLKKYNVQQRTERN